MSRLARDERGFTLIEVMMAAAVLAVIAAIAVTFYADIAARARMVKAHADIRTLTNAVYEYAEATGRLPASLQILEAAPSSPVAPVAAVPDPPTGWSAYVYVRSDAGFSIIASGDGVTVFGPCNPCPYVSAAR
jgi:prepilin-type N-terminal cleavage/methylation domain-containing protein